ncbi:glycosyltransferase [uncultured Jannaschia sp.]|uniref:glycosyltransferase n=1 Tax=uncultured Jannaschia sp. TaxID=293347 RepID=UPI00262B8014|nr:glycosyltransferase [uncultured Jannaschia sp.]
MSFVVPVYSGEDHLEAVVRAVEAERAALDSNPDAPSAIVELILVDDAAIDGSPALIDRLAESASWIVPVHLSRNYGQHAATVAGIMHSSGDWVITIDEDGQHPPDRVFDLLSHAVSHGADVVYARPTSGTVHQKVWRDGSSRTFKRAMEWLTSNPTLRLVNSFRLIRGPIARATASVCGHSTYFDVALFWFTQRIEAVEMELRDQRFIETGRSGYNLKRLFAHAMRMLFSSQVRFLGLGLWIGAALFASSFLAGLYFLILRIVAPETIGVPGWTSLFTVVCMSGGLLAIMVGLCLQYLSTLVLKAHGKPTFFTIDRSGDARLVEWFAHRSANTP